VNFDDIKTGAEIPPLHINVSIVQMIMYCAVTWDFARYHYDPEFVHKFGFSRPVVDPQMHGGLMARLLTDWISQSGRINKMSLSYRAPCFLGDTLTYSGKVVNKYVKDGERYVDCALVVTNKNRESSVEGAASISFY